MILEHGLSVNFLGRTIFISIEYESVCVCVIVYVCVCGERGRYKEGVGRRTIRNSIKPWRMLLTYLQGFRDGTMNQIFNI